MVRPVPTMIKEAAHRLPPIEDHTFGSRFDSFGQSRVVLIGAGSETTKKRLRADTPQPTATTQHLITHHGFNIVAIEADWPDAEECCRAVLYGGGSGASWNLRDSHFFGTLARLLRHRKGGGGGDGGGGGQPAKAVVWAHNSHVGDARFTGTGESGNELDLGQLCKEQWGASCSIVGCGTHTGTVAAAHEWDDPMEVMAVKPSREDSYERLMRDTGVLSFMLDLRKGVLDEELWKELMKKRLERFIGVIYRPDTERWSHYSTAVLPRQMDCLLWFDETEAVHAFETAQPDEQPSAGETYPFGL